MADIWMDVDTAVVVPMSLMPIVQNDGLTIEQALVYDFAGIAVQWNFVTTAGAYTCVAITPTTGDDHDISEPLANVGMYGIEIPASAGDVNNDTEGFGWITGSATGLMPWRGPTIGFRAAAINNSLIDGATIDVNVTAQANIDFGATQKASINTEVDNAIVTYNLDHLALTATAGADMTTEVADNTILSRILANGDTSAFVPSTDGLQLIRDKLTDIETDTDVIDDGTSGLVKIASDVAAVLVDTGTTLQGEVDAIQAAVITNAAGTDIAADIIAIKAETATIVADTNELQSDDYPTSIAALQTDLDTLTDARGEPAQGAPPVSASTNLKIDHMYKRMRNKQDSDGTTEQYYNDDTTTVDSKRTVSAAAGTVTKTEIVTGP